MDFAKFFTWDYGCLAKEIDTINLVEFKFYPEVLKQSHYNHQNTESKLVGKPEYSSSLPSSSQFSTSSVQSKDTINTQISRNTLEPPSPFPQPRNSGEITNSNNNTRRPSAVSFSFRKNSITPPSLHR